MNFTSPCELCDSHLKIQESLKPFSENLKPLFQNEPLMLNQIVSASSVSFSKAFVPFLFLQCPAFSVQKNITAGWS